MDIKIVNPEDNVLSIQKVEVLKKLKRQTYDIGLFGKKGDGKTYLLSLMGRLQQIFNYATVFSNYPLNYPHILCKSIMDLNKIYNYDVNTKKIFLGDDFERWFSSKTAKSKINKELNDILLDWGKINCSIYYTAKRSMAILIDLRENTSEFWFPELYLTYESKDEKINNQLKNYLNFLEINVTRYDENIEELPSLTFTNLQNYVYLFDTTTQVQPIQEGTHE